MEVRISESGCTRYCLQRYMGLLFLGTVIWWQSRTSRLHYRFRVARFVSHLGAEHSVSITKGNEMTESDDTVRRIAINYGIDGDSQTGDVDGYLSSEEIRNGIARLRTLQEGATSPDSGDEAFFSLSLNPENYAEMVGALERMLPAAIKAEENGEPGIKYMAEEFYRLGLEPDQIRWAICADHDCSHGNDDGLPTRDEFRNSMANSCMIDDEQFKKIVQKLPPK